MNRKFLKAILMKYSGIVGAGIFILPFIFNKSNFFFSLFCLAVITAIMIFIDQLYIDVITGTKENHQLSGYANQYLGKTFATISTINMLILGFGVTSAFIQLGATYISKLLPGSPFFVYQLIFLSFLGLFHSSGHRFIEKITQYIPVISLIIVYFLFFTSIKIPFSSLSFYEPSFQSIGVLVFAITGFVIIPDINRFLKHEKQRRIKLIMSNLFGTLLAALTYVIFVIAVLLISGSNISPDSISGLLLSSPKLGVVMAILGVVLTFKACLNFIHSLKIMFIHDLNYSRNKSLLLSLSIPFIALLLSKFPIIKIISVTGTITISVSAFIIVCVKLSQWKQKLKKSKKSSILSM